MQVRTRIAPSPTGDLHIGHLRTVLYNYAFAKKHGGTFVVRIEDTDRTRYVEGAMERTLAVLNDYGFSWDEGPNVGGPYGPYIQSERLPIFKEYAEKLVKEGNAYYCFCTSERLQTMREEQQKQGLPVTKYDRTCRNLSQEEIKDKFDSGVPYVIRLKVPDNEIVKYTDDILGEVTFNSNDVDDQVLLKSDGFPTYHLAVVIDDHLMNITHVYRGNDWIPSTPKQVLLYRAFGWEMPHFGHLPNLKDKGSTKKLGKRFGSTKSREFLAEGYLPEATLNYLMFLGWNPGTEREMYTLDEFIKDFSIERVQKSDLVSFDRDKLDWFNGIYIRNLSVAELMEKLRDWSKNYDPFAEELNTKLAGCEPEFNFEVLRLVKERLTTLSEFNELTTFFYSAPEVNPDLAMSYCGTKERLNEILKNFIDAYTQVSQTDWTVEKLDALSHELLQKFNYKPKEAFMTLRVVITGQTATPPLFEIMALLGKAEVEKRMRILFA
jgi:glutamyl-tRNA synthetase